MIEIKVEGMDRLIRKFAGYPGRLKTAMGKAMWASLLILWENEIGRASCRERVYDPV